MADKKYLDSEGLQILWGEIKRQFASVQDSEQLNKILDMLQGGEDIEGSIANTVKDAVDKILDGVDVDYDTLKEIAQWITDQGSQNTADIVLLKASLEEIQPLSEADILAILQ